MEKAPLPKNEPSVTSWDPLHVKTFTGYSDFLEKFETHGVEADVFVIQFDSMDKNILNEELAKAVIAQFRAQSKKPIALVSDNMGARKVFLNAGGDIALPFEDKEEMLPRLVIAFNKRMLQNSIAQFGFEHITTAYDDLILVDDRQKKISLAGEALKLPRAEYLILETLITAAAEDPAQYVPFEDFKRDVHGQPYTSINSLKTKVSNIREKIKPHFTINGSGKGSYQLVRIDT